MNTHFDKNDHRNFNREGAAFDKGETFSGIPYEIGIKAVDKIKALVPDQNFAAFALKWILMHPEVSCIIPGASSADQVKSNLQAEALPNITNDVLQQIDKIYTEEIKPWVHQRW